MRNGTGVWGKDGSNECPTKGPARDKRMKSKLGVGFVVDDVWRDGSDYGGHDEQEHSGEAGNFGRWMVGFDVLLVGFVVSGGNGVNPESGLNHEKDEGEGKESDDISFSVMHASLRV